MENVNVGDVVYLNGQSVGMTVTRVDRENKTINTIWIDDNKEPHVLRDKSFNMFFM